MVFVRFHNLFLSFEKKVLHGISAHFFCLKQSWLRQSRSRHSAILFFTIALFSTTAKADLNLIPNIDQLESNTASSLQNMYTQYSSFISPTFANSNVNSDTATDAQLEAAFVSVGKTAVEANLFAEIREVVHTSNEQQGSGPTLYSLSLDNEGVRDVLRWFTNEEVSTAGTLATNTTNTQVVNIIARLTTLRNGISGFSVAGLRMPRQTKTALAQTDVERLDGSRRGGSAGNELEAAKGFSKLGGFVNGALGFGSRDPTTFEDAVDFDTASITAGVDYRLSNQTVVGAALGYSQLDSTYDGARSIVSGSVDSTGYSLSLYGLHEIQQYYFDGLLSYGRNDYDFVRRIAYPSNNPNVSSTNETALGNTKSNQFTASLGAGMQLQNGSYSFGPYARLKYLQSKIDGYTETNATAFNYKTSGQDITSSLLSLGFTGSKSITLKNAVVLPQLTVELIHEFDNDERVVKSPFANDTITGVLITTQSDKPDRDYLVIGIGSSAVFKNGLQGFINIDSIFGLKHVESTALSIGLRREF